MTRALLSSHWYRIAHLRPRLRGTARLHRHVYRGQVWHVVEDRANGRFHRFNPAAYRLIALLDGQRDLQAVWDLLAADPRDDTPGQDEIAALLGQLHAADLVQADVTPDVAELFERHAKDRRRKWLGRIGNPISIKLPLWDPDRFVVALLRAAPWLADRRALLLWLALVLPAFALVPAHWAELAGNLRERLLAADSLLLLAVAFPLVKLLHELGHALACRARGGEVHELGVMLMVFYPVPYVDASASTGFAAKRERMLVGAAGMLTELLIAALAFYAWLALEPGFARSAAYAVFVLGSATTLLFNANPLLRYDGYYILADAIEVPNLASRATRHWRWIADRWLFGVQNPESVPPTAGERRWFLLYAPLSFAYRLFVTFGIAAFIAGQYLVVGTVLGIWAVVATLGVPAWRALRALASDAVYAEQGGRVRGVLAGAAVLVALALFGLPLPYHTHAEGVVWLPEQAIVRAGGAGFVGRIAAGNGATVAVGQAVVETVDPGLAAQREAQVAKVEEAQAQVDAAWGTSPVRAQQLEEALKRETATLAQTDDQIAHLTARADSAGRLVIADEAKLPGRWVKRGDVLAQVVTGEPPLVRTVVTQAEVDRVRADTRSVEVRLPTAPGRSFPATLKRTVPAAAAELPSPVLGQQGGGTIAMDPRDSKGLRSLESRFQFELELPTDVPAAYPGSRVYLRFQHAAEPIGWRWWRGLRRSFLTLFHV